MEVYLSVVHRYQIPARTRWTICALAGAAIVAMNPAAQSQTRGPANRFGFDGTGKNLTDVALRTRIATDAVRW